MGIEVQVVDAFSAVPFAGNPAAVCVLSEWPDVRWMQSVAGEMNLSETAFLVGRAGDAWDLRWFTPTLEVDLCGHATLAAAHVLWETGRLSPDSAAHFHTRSGSLRCHRHPSGEVSMDFPVRAARVCDVPAGLAAALGADIRWCGRSADDFLVELPHAAIVRRLDPDLARLAEIPARGVIVTAASDQGDHDFVSRFFAPAAGVPEDPVTGSTHCTLAPYWGSKLGRNRMRGWQASRRGGSVGVEWSGDRVVLTGAARTTWRGELLA